MLSSETAENPFNGPNACSVRQRRSNKAGIWAASAAAPLGLHVEPALTARNKTQFPPLPSPPIDGDILIGAGPQVTLSALGGDLTDREAKGNLIAKSLHTHELRRCRMRHGGC